MRRGQWLDKSQLDFARVNGFLTLVNGHHRMHAQIAAGVNILWNIVIHECFDEHELRGLYYRFDTNIRKRSGSNIISGIGFADGNDLPKQMADKLFQAAPIIGRGFCIGNSPKNADDALASRLTDDRIAICQKYVEEARMFAALTKGSALRKKLFAASIVAVAMVTLKSKPDLALEFWRGVAEDDGLSRGDPRKTYINDLLTRNGNNGRQAAKAMAAARGWNAFYRGQKLSHLKVTGTPVVIAGTEFTVR